MFKSMLTYVVGAARGRRLGQSIEQPVSFMQLERLEDRMLLSTTLMLSDADIDEGDSTDLSGILVDAEPLEQHTVTIDWGDGSLETVLVLAPGVSEFESSHTYEDDDPTGTPSDVYTIDVAVADSDDDSDQIDVLVNNAAPVIAEFASDATFGEKGEEGVAVNVAGTFTDVGVADTHSAVVDWGDGSDLEEVTLVEVAGVVEIEGSHEYDAGGIYTITLTVTDDDTGSTSATTTAVITGVGVNDGVLWIIGTNDEDGDRVQVHQVGHNRIMVHANFVEDASRTYMLADITENKLISYLCEGDDHMRISGRTTLTTIIHGGEGDDKLQAGSGLNALFGEGGDDKLNGKRGRDLLVGGEGEDRIVGSKGQDILIGGVMDDTTDDHVMDVLMLWGDESTSYNDRVIDVQSILNVTDDGDDKDKLVGGSDRDLFYGGIADMLRSAKPHEVKIISGL